MMKTKKQFLTEEVLHSLEVLKNEGDVTELRILNTKHLTVSGYYNDMEKLVKEVVGFNGQVPAIYVTLNPVKPELLARAKNRVEKYAKKTTTDADIKYRMWLPIDLDPVRPSGISSTDEEHEASILLAKEIRAYLTDQGWSDPILADSGNGAHLLYLIDLPNDDVSRKLVKAVLESLDFKFSNKQVQVDTSTFNAARIWKLYGTKSCKGDHTEERPHRVSEILEYPDEISGIMSEQLQALADELPTLVDSIKSTSKTQMENKRVVLKCS